MRERESGDEKKKICAHEYTTDASYIVRVYRIAFSTFSIVAPPLPSFELV